MRARVSIVWLVGACALGGVMSARAVVARADDGGVRDLGARDAGVRAADGGADAGTAETATATESATATATESARATGTASATATESASESATESASESATESATAAESASESATATTTDPPRRIPTFGARARGTPRPDERAANASSDTDLDLARLQDVPRTRAEQLLTLAPGVLLTNHAGEGHASSLFLRGFDAGEGQDVEMLVDGVPFNDPSNAHGHGYADAGFVIPELVERLRFVEGPFDPSQGDFALAGSAEYTLGLARRGVRATAEAGTYGHQRLLLTWGPEAMSHETFVGVDLRRGDGFGPNRAYTSASAMAQIARSLGRGWRGALFATGYISDFASAGVVRLDDIDADRLTCPSGEDPFYCVGDSAQGGASSRASVGARIAWRKGYARYEQTIWFAARRLRIRENFTGNLVDARGDGLDELYDTSSVGTRGRYRIERRIRGRQQSIELGFIARRTDGETRQDRLRAGGGAPYATLFDDGIGLTNIGAYVSLDVRPWSWLALRGGVRVDAYGFALERRSLPTMDREGARLDVERADALGLAFAPRGTVDVRLVRWLHWLTSAGVGTRSSDAQALSDGERAPFAQATSVETGLALSHGSVRKIALDLRAAAFDTRVTQDLVFDAERGRNSYVGPSNRYGALVSGRLRVGKSLDALISGTWTEAHLAPAGASVFDLAAGARLPYVPRFVGRADVAGRRTWRIAGEPIEFGASIGFTVLAARPLPLGTFGEPYALLDASVRARWRMLELAVVGRNLLDAQWHAYELAYQSNFGSGTASMLPATHIAAGAPFTCFVSLTVTIPTGEEEEESP